MDLNDLMWFFEKGLLRYFSFVGGSVSGFSWGRAMKVIVYDRYGPPEVLRVAEAPKPVPKDDEILIKVRVMTVTSGDWRLRSMNVPTGFKLISRLIFGVLRPRRRILGMELAGIVEAVGKDVTAFKAGDAVFGFDSKNMGCYAEYKCMAQDGPVAAKPDNLPFEEAAALSFGGTTALYFLGKARLQSGQKILINGASGGVGTALVQLAKHFGAEVTGVCSGANADMVKSLGADRVIDYTKEDFTKNGQMYDVIIDTAGTAPYARSKGSLKAGGRLVLVQSGLPEMLRAPWISLISDKKVIAGPASEKPQDVRLLGELAEAGQFKPVIDRRYPFDEIVEAHKYVDAGHKRGNVIVTLE